MIRCEEAGPWNSVAMWNRSLSLSVSSMARLPTADEMNPLMANGLVIDVLTLASTARKNESCRWMRLKSESPSYSQWPLLFTYWRCRAPHELQRHGAVDDLAARRGHVEPGVGILDRRGKVHGDAAEGVDHAREASKPTEM